MPRVCTVCTNPEREAIDRLLVSGASIRETSALYRVSEDALSRHKQEHLPKQLMKAQEATEIAQADDLLRELRALHAKAISLLLQAEKIGDYRTALSGIREARGCLELMAKLQHELDDRPQVNVFLSPDWERVETAILTALADQPSAKQRVIDALSRVVR